MTSTRAHWTACPECHDVTAFEQPPCTEGHDGACPEWFCVSCGYAIWEGAVIDGELNVITFPRPARRLARPA
jgi:hypothetical protein